MRRLWRMCMLADGRRPHINDRPWLGQGQTNARQEGKAYGPGRLPNPVWATSAPRRDGSMQPPVGPAESGSGHVDGALHRGVLLAVVPEVALVVEGVVPRLAGGEVARVEGA